MNTDSTNIDAKSTSPLEGGGRSIGAWLHRSLAGVWLSWLALIGLCYAQILARVIHPLQIPFFFLLAAFVGLTVFSFVLWVRNLERCSIWKSSLLLMAALAPAAITCYSVYEVFDRTARRDMTPSMSLKLLVAAGATVGEAQAQWTFPRRLESERLVMFFTEKTPSPEADLAAMEEHVSQLEQELKLPLRTKIYWVRGSVLGKSGIAVLGLALGSRQGDANSLDKHELAHAVINQHLHAGVLPVMMLNEGWAESKSNEASQLYISAAGLRTNAQQFATLSRAQFERDASSMLVDPKAMLKIDANMREFGEPRFFEATTGPELYYNDNGPAYTFGGAFVHFLIKSYGIEKFKEIYFQGRLGNFSTEVRRIYGKDIAAIENEFWSEVDSQIKPAE